MRRITIERWRKKKTFVVVKPPYPEVGDAVALNGVDWLVCRVEPTEGFVIKFPKKKKK